MGSKKLKSVINGGVEVRDNGGLQFPVFAKELSERFGLTAGQKLSKAVITAGGWTTGIIEEEADRFIDYVVDESAFLPLIRRVPMTGRVRNIDKLGLGSTVFKKGTPGTDPGDTVSLSGPTQIQLIAVEIIAIVSIGDDTLEDNIEGDAFVQHLLGMIARAGSNEIEQAIIHGDTGTADAGILDRWDGVLVKAAADGYHALDATADATLFWAGANGVKGSKAIRAMPTKFRRDKSKLRFFVHPDAYINYEDDLAGNVSPDAFQAITVSRDLPLKGVQHVRVPLIRTDLAHADLTNTATVAILTDPMNFIWGVQREIRIEAERQARKRATDFVVTLRGDVQVETGDAVVVYENLKIDPA